MLRYLSSALSAAALVGVTALAPLTAAATPPTVTSLSTSTTTGCAFPTSSFGGVLYCPTTVVGVRNTTSGTGARVVLKGVTVTAVTSSTVTVGAWESPPCPPGMWCGASLTLQSLTVSWSGTSRPRYGDVLDLFGRTITASLTPVGYVKTGFCPIEYC